MTDSISPTAVGRLREALAAMKKSDTWAEIVEPRDGVLARFQPMFQPAYLPSLSIDEFKSFLYFENNKHWTSLYRQGPRLCANLSKLRQALGVLVDESRPIGDRLNQLDGFITGMGKAIMTAILLVAYPDRYGVWNNVSEAGLVELGLWPMFQRGEPFGSRYQKVNGILCALRDALGIDLWTLDALWWQISRSDTPPGCVDRSDVAAVHASAMVSQQFGLECHLHEFMVNNWDRLDIGRDWAIYSEPGDEQAGYEYACKIGRIDILARHRREPKWLVIELKRSEASDAVVGQALRYMGWVGEHLASEGEEVRGLIIAHQADTALQYAVRAVPNLALQLYEVEFRLKQPGMLPAEAYNACGE